MSWPNADLDSVLGVDENHMLCLHAVTDEDGHPMEKKDESGRRICEFWCSTFQTRVEDPRHHQYEDILRFVQKTPDDIGWAIGNISLKARRSLSPRPLTSMTMEGLFDHRTHISR